jgi:hypothetical protein
MKVIRFVFRAIGGTIKWTLMVVALLVVIGIVLAIVKAGKNSHSTGATVMVLTEKVHGTFVRSGCLGCGPLAPKIVTSDAYCGWSKSSVIVHVRMRNTSAERVTVHWHPSYSIVNGAPHGTGLSSIQDTRLKAGQAENVYVSQKPKGVAAGSRIARCYPSFEDVSSG